jgi:hypothetical protein
MAGQSSGYVFLRTLFVTVDISLTITSFVGLLRIDKRIDSDSYLSVLTAYIKYQLVFLFYSPHVLATLPA